jgi:hypothetical protein
MLDAHDEFPEVTVIVQHLRKKAVFSRHTVGPSGTAVTSNFLIQAATMPHGMTPMTLLSEYI